MNFPLLLTFALCAGALGPAGASPSSPSLALPVAQTVQGFEVSPRIRLNVGVGELRRPGNSLPGEVIAFGDQAFLVATGSPGDIQRGVIAAAVYGQGRVVAFGHSSYFRVWDTEGDGPSFLANAMRWSSSLEEPRMGYLGGGMQLAAQMGDEFLGAKTELRPSQLAARLPELDGLVWVGGELDAEQLAALDKFVADGGGLLVGVCPWGNQQIWSGQGQGRSIRTDLSQNKLLVPMGLVFGDATVGDATYATRGTMPHAGRAVTAAIHHIKAEGQPQKPDEFSELSPGALASAVASLLRALPPGDQRYLPQIETALGAASFGERVPSAAGPMSKSDVAGYLGMLLATEAWKSAAPAAVQAAPGADFFPGAVPPTATRAPYQVAYSDDQVSRGGWLSTGRYAAPGELVRVVVKPGTSTRGWSLRIGAHKDLLWHKDSWTRWPEITIERRIDVDANGSFPLASPFGGPIYLVPSKGAGPLALTLEGTVEAPLFVLGDERSLADWPRRRQAPAPWAELVSDGMILTVPSGAVRELEDPAALMQYWQRATECYPELRQEPQPQRAERLVEDIQISAGWMHSGYPVMTHGAERTDHSFATDLKTLVADGNWGYFHEFGHNAQRPEWTFSGTGEVTCNLFSLYLGQQMAGIEPWENPWLQGQKGKAQKYFDAGADFAQWKKQPGLALLMYATIQRDFGWQPFQDVFEVYVAMDQAAKPRSDDAKRDAWLVNMSTVLERDLGPYFKVWGVPTSEEARAKVTHFEPWIPKEYSNP